jgi:radical SAM protein with 4Fe4S-binding SPASM domain
LAQTFTRYPALPAFIDIEPNNYCNFRCPHCQVTHWNKPRTNLDVDKLKAILDQLPTLLSVKLQGMGEPLLNKQTLPMLETIQRRGIKTESDTLLKLGTEGHFSLDGASEEVFQSMRVGSSFNKVIENVRKLSARRKDKKQILAARTVVTKQNVSQLSEIVLLVAELGLDRLTLQLVLTSWGKTLMEELNALRRVEETPELDEQLAKAKAEAERFELPLEIKTDDKYSREKKCRWPWKSAYIASNGDVIPCCILADSDTVKMGNVFEEEFATIWNSAKYQELRRQIREHELASYCKGCYVDA